MCSKEEMLELFAKQSQENQENMEATVKAAVETAISSSSLNINSRMDGFSTKLDSILKSNSQTNNDVQDQLSGFQQQIRDLQQSVDEKQIRHENELVQLKGLFNQFQENALSTAGIVNKEDIANVILPVVENELLPKIREDIKKEILSPVKATWNAIQAEKVHEHEHSIVVFGYKSDGSAFEAAGSFLKDELKVSETDLLKVSIKQTYRLGKGDTSKPPPLLIRFGHPSERNMILTFSKNLKGKKIKVERHIPKNYQNQHRAFKDLAWKLKTMPDFDYKTQIIFDSHVLILRYRSPDTTTDKFHWTIHSSWEPPMDSKQVEKSTLRVPAGSKATPIPDISILNKANCAVFMTVKDLTEKITEDSFKVRLVDYLNVDHKTLIQEVKATKRPDLYILYFDSWVTAKNIATVYKEKFSGKDVSFTLFSQNDPASMH